MNWYFLQRAAQAFPAAVVIALGVLLAGCTDRPAQPAQPEPAPSPSRPRVIASFFPIYDFARQLAGEHFDVACLTTPGSDPHAMDATPAIARSIAQADTILVLGLGMDSWAEKLARSQKRPVVVLAEGLPVRKSSPPDIADSRAEAGHTPDSLEDDPHLWLDPILARELVDRIAAELSRIAPEHRSAVESRRARLLQELNELHTEFEKGLSQVQRRELVTFHGAFGYLFQRYGLRTLGVIELFPGNEPSAAYLRQLISLMRKHKLQVIFAEPQLPDRPAQILAREINGRIERLDPCETILEQAPHATYIERQRSNLATLRKALETP